MNRDDQARSYIAALGLPARRQLKSLPACCGNIDMLRGVLTDLCERSRPGQPPSNSDLAEARWAIHVAAQGHDLSAFAALNGLRATLGDVRASDRRLLGLDAKS
jgi:hypothetical protein